MPAGGWRTSACATAGSQRSATSAELRPGQLDSDSLPDYELLDSVLARYVDGDAGVEMIVSEGVDPDLVRAGQHLGALSFFVCRLPTPTVLRLRYYGERHAR